VAQRRKRGDQPGTRVTLQDVADRAGVSLTTASRVVNDGSRQVGQALADRVRKAVAELGYTADLQARAVATGQSTLVGVIVHDISDPYFSSIAAGVIEAARSRQLLACMSSVPAAGSGPAAGGGVAPGAVADAAELDYVALMRAQRARAVILIGSRSDDVGATEALRAEIAAFTAAGGRAACVGQDLLGIDTVLPENRLGAQALAKALAVQGHHSFAVLAGPRGLLTARDRLDGFRDGLAAWSVELDPARVVHCPFSRDGGYEGMSAILAAGPPLPDCVFAVTDVMAVGALARLRAAGLAVPEQMAVAGFDDISTLRR
jgi:LacI family transcriptional regulator